MASSQGGGFGVPLERDHEAVRRSSREGFTSLKAPHDIYGVVMNTEPEEYEVDYEAINKLKEELMEKRKEDK